MGVVVLLVVVAIVAIIVVAVGMIRSKARSEASDLAGIGANEFLKSPPSSFPADPPAEKPKSTPTGAKSPTGERGVDADDADPDQAAAETDADGADATDDGADDDDAAIARFRSPGTRSSGLEALAKPIVAPVAAYYLEGPSDQIIFEEIVTPAKVDDPEEIVLPREIVIDLTDAPAEVRPTPRHALAAAPWQELVLASEPDAVDHVLEALINRARFKQVGVEEVATELVERSDLKGDQVSDVLASLVGRADGGDAQPSSELTLFNDEVPSRPGQLTDFAKLNPVDKKRIIVRVLCLLVARSEDQQLPPRVESSGAKNQSWPLARAVWPVASGAGDEDGDAPLPSRRLAKSR